MDVFLTGTQAQLLAWIIEQGGSVLLSEPMLGERTETLIGNGDANLDIDGADFRELAEQGLIRHVSGRRYEATNLGKAYDIQRRSPPAERPRPGFRPPEDP